MAPDPAPRLPGPVAFFDGECNVCDRAVRFLLRHDRAGVLHYASLQGTTAAALQAAVPAFPRDLDTFVLAEPGGAGAEPVRITVRTDGIARAMELTGGLGGRARLLRLVPRPLRDALYRRFASLRHRLFGRKDVCALPTPDERARLLP